MLADIFSEKQEASDTKTTTKHQPRQRQSQHQDKGKYKRKDKARCIIVLKAHERGWVGGGKEDVFVVF